MHGRVVRAGVLLILGGRRSEAPTALSLLDGRRSEVLRPSSSGIRTRYAHKVIHETHMAWYKLVESQLGGDFGFQLPKVETLRDVDSDTNMVRNLSNQDLASIGK